MFRGSTLDALGSQLGVSRQFIQQLEVGTRTPGTELIDALAAALGYPADYFSAPLEVEVSERACNFRSRRSTKKVFRERVAAYATHFAELLALLQKYLTFPKPNLKRVRPLHGNEAEETAELYRDEWGIGADRPISNVTRALENAGIIVTSFTGISSDIDAMSVAEPFPFIFFSTDKGSSTRSRFDLAHELGHLAMHEPQMTGTAETERAADEFASAFLLPRRAFASEFPAKTWGWPALFELKGRWGASLSAIVRRAHDLELIDALQYRSANMYLRRRGWHKGEPREPDREKPEAVALAFAELERAYGLKPRDIAGTLHVKQEVLSAVTGLAAPLATP